MLLTKVPGMTMFAPSSYQELQQMFSDALEITTGPVAIRYPRTPAPSVPETEVGSGLNARLVSEGVDICILSVGKMLETAQSAAEILEQNGHSVSVWDVRAVAPLDSEMLAAAHKHSLVVTLEDGIIEGGIGSSIANHLRQLTGSTPTIITKGVPVSFVDQGNPDDLLSELGLDPSGIVHAILEADF
jgi:1-deoxy-D-xylulose-5-phosphate synthase